MKIVKPHNKKTTTNQPQNGKQTRLIKLKGDVDSDNPSQTSDALSSNNERTCELLRAEFGFYLAMWVSTIDKTFTKKSINRKNKEGETEEQKNSRLKEQEEQAKPLLKLRKQVTALAWKRIAEKHQDLMDKSHDQKDEQQWYRKCDYEALYGKENSDQSGKSKKPSKTLKKGRFYDAFVHEDSDFAEAIIQRIEKHLYQEQVRSKHASKKHKPKGKIDHVLNSIAQNGLIRTLKRPADWSCEDINAYFEHFDEKDYQQNLKPQAFAAFLYKHYTKVFRDDSNKLLLVADAKNQAGLFAIHQALKDMGKRVKKRRTYSHHSQDGEKQKSYQSELPACKEKLIKSLNHHQDNRIFNHWIRLGKIAYYADCWQQYDSEKVSRSKYWSSEYQAQIKRNEAFVRVLRRVAAFAEQTLVTNQKRKDCIVINSLSNEDAISRLRLLFGDERFEFNGDKENAAKSLLKKIVSDRERIRSATIHFKDIDALLHNITDLSDNNNPKLSDNNSHVGNILNEDKKNRIDRLINVLKGAHFGQYHIKGLALETLLCDLCTLESSESVLPLPRLQRLLHRCANAKFDMKHNGKSYVLPPKRSQEDEQDKPRHLQRTLLHQLYTRKFPSWWQKLGYSQQGTEKLKSWIVEAQRASNQAAKNQHDMPARVAKLALKHAHDVKTFFHALAAETALEFGVQQGYEAHAGGSRKQADFIENLKCDVIGRAFLSYLNEKKYTSLLDEKNYQKCDSEHGLERPNAADDHQSEDWEALFYLHLHLIPVGVVSDLMHQLKKYALLAGKSDLSEDDNQKLQPLLAVMQLYLDMHDSRYTGDDAQLRKWLNEQSLIKQLYQDPSVFKQIFTQPKAEQPAQAIGQNQRNGEHIHQEQLTQVMRKWRELRRFGLIGHLCAIAQKEPITSEECDRVRNSQKNIEEKQKKRHQLHEEWVKEKNNKQWLKDHKEKYQTLVKDISSYQYLKNRVYGDDLVRLHRLCLAVAARLVDYSGLYERDLFFALIGLCHDDEKSISKEISEKDLKNLKNGMFLKWTKSESIKKLVEGDLPKAKKRIKIMLKEDRSKTRNDLAHFDYLSWDSFNLTKQINRTRKLMSYDLKLKNAVSKSIKDLLYEHGLNIKWQIDKQSTLRCTEVRSREIKHLETSDIKEALHGQHYVRMVARLFGCTNLDQTHKDESHHAKHHSPRKPARKDQKASLSRPPQRHTTHKNPLWSSELLLKK